MKMISLAMRLDPSGRESGDAIDVDTIIAHYYDVPWDLCSYEEGLSGHSSNLNCFRFNSVKLQLALHYCPKSILDIHIILYDKFDP